MIDQRVSFQHVQQAYWEWENFDTLKFSEFLWDQEPIENVFYDDLLPKKIEKTIEIAVNNLWNKYIFLLEIYSKNQEKRTEEIRALEDL